MMTISHMPSNRPGLSIFMSDENYLERMDRQFAKEQRFNRHIRGEIINAAVAVRKQH